MYSMVKLVIFSIHYFYVCAGEDVPVVPWPRALVVSPWAVVPVCTKPSSLSMKPMDPAGIRWGPILVSGASVLTSLASILSSTLAASLGSGRVSSASSITATSVSSVAPGPGCTPGGFGCCHLLSGDGRDADGPVGGPDVVRQVEDGLVGGGAELHVRYMDFHHSRERLSPNSEDHAGAVTILKWLDLGTDVI